MPAALQSPSAAKDDARVEAAMEGMRPTVVMSTTRRAGMPDRAAA